MIAGYPAGKSAADSARAMTWFGRPRDPQEQHGFDLIGAEIKRRRLALGWTQRLLEAQSGIDQTVISRIENGKQYGIRWSRFALLVDALGGFGPLAAREPRPGPTRRPLEPPRSRVVDLTTGDERVGRPATGTRPSEAEPHARPRRRNMPSIGIERNTRRRAAEIKHQESGRGVHRRARSRSGVGARPGLARGGAGANLPSRG